MRAKGLVAVTLPLLALIVAITAYSVLQRRQRDAEELVTQTLEVQSQITTLLASLLNAETGVRGFLLTGQDQFLEPYRLSLTATPRDLAHLADLVRDDASQTARVRRMESLVAARLDVARRLVDADTAVASGPELEQLLIRGKQAMDAVRAEVAEMLATEDDLLAERSAKERRSDTNLNVAMYAAALVGLAGGVAAVSLFTRGVVRRVRQVEENARRLNDGLPLTPVSGRDEVGRLAATLTCPGWKGMATDPGSRTAPPSPATVPTRCEAPLPPRL